MTATLQEAIAAARDGDTERAQLLAAEVVQDNPDDANAWYLLSQLVDSDARRAAYLSKTLTLDPSHARARAEFDALPTEASAVLAVPAAVAVAALEPDIAVVAVEPELLPADEPADVPEWLQPLSPDVYKRQVEEWAKRVRQQWATRFDALDALLRAEQAKSPKESD